MYALPRQEDPASLAQLGDAVCGFGFSRAQVGMSGPQRLTEAPSHRGLRRLVDLTVEAQDFQSPDDRIGDRLSGP